MEHDGPKHRAPDARPFVFVSLPDTQVYAEDRVPDGRFPAVTDPRGTGAIFFDQTRWIVRNARKLGIRYVGHLGDIVQNGNDLDEWALVHDAMRLLLGADIPHGTVMGNHDDNHGPDYMRNYLDHFGPEHFADRSWFTASSPGGGANLQLLQHGPWKLGFLNFSIDHPQSELDWAKGIIEAHPDAIFVIGTHRYLYDFKLFGGRYDEVVSTAFGDIAVPGGAVPGVVEPNTAEELFHEIVTQHPNILMIHAGHFHAEWLRLDGLNGAAQTVIQILTDYQSTRNGGDGWLRVYALDFEKGTFSFDTYSPTLDRRRSTIDHYVETIFLAWEQRGQIKELLEAVLGGPVDDATYVTFLKALFGRDPNIPDDFLLQHPDLDEPHEQAYFDRYLDELFLGDPPPDFSNIHDWEKLWMQAFAADPSDPFNFEPSLRSPSLTLEVDFASYFTPSAEQALAFAFGDLLDAIADLDQGDFPFRSARDILLRRVQHAFWKAKKGRPLQAAHVLEHLVRLRTDGCAERGEPDGPPFTFGFFGHGFAHVDPVEKQDWIVSCEAQDTIHPRVVEVLELLADDGPALAPSAGRSRR